MFVVMRVRVVMFIFATMLRGLLSVLVMRRVAGYRPGSGFGIGFIILRGR